MQPGCGWGRVRRPITRGPRTGGIRRQVSDTTSPASGIYHPSKAPTLVVAPALRPLLHFLVDDPVERLSIAVTGAVRRRGPTVQDGPSRLDRGAETPCPPNSEASHQDTVATPGQERVILAAIAVGLEPEPIAMEFCVSRAIVQHVVTATRRDHCKTERNMIEIRPCSGTPVRMNPPARDTMTTALGENCSQYRKSARDNALGQAFQPRLWAHRTRGRKTYRRRKATHFGAGMVALGGVPVRAGSLTIAAKEHMRSTHIEFLRLPYDDRTANRCRAADRKIEYARPVAASQDVPLRTQSSTRQRLVSRQEHRLLRSCHNPDSALLSLTVTFGCRH